MMVLFSSKVLQGAPPFNGDKKAIPKLDEEINRLFRSNAFNIITRSIADNNRKNKYECLKEVPAGASK